MEAIIEVDEVLELGVEGRECHDEECLMMRVSGEEAARRNQLGGG